MVKPVVLTRNRREWLEADPAGVGCHFPVTRLRSGLLRGHQLRPRQCPRSWFDRKQRCRAVEQSNRVLMLGSIGIRRRGISSENSIRSPSFQSRSISAQLPGRTVAFVALPFTRSAVEASAHAGTRKVMRISQAGPASAAAMFRSNSDSSSSELRKPARRPASRRLSVPPSRFNRRRCNIYSWHIK